MVGQDGDSLFWKTSHEVKIQIIDVNFIEIIYIKSIKILIFATRTMRTYIQMYDFNNYYFFLLLNFCT